MELVQPDCDNENTPSFESIGENVVMPFVADGPLTPGTTVTITATAVEGAMFEDESTTQEFEFVIDPAEEGCDIVSPPEEVTPVAPGFVDPDCTTEPQVTTTEVEGVQYDVSGDVVPGGTVEVTASAIEPAVLAEGAETFWTHTFAEVTGCGEVLPPQVSPPTVTPTVVSAGLLPDVPDSRGDRGLVLLATGMLLMLVAAGLGMVRPGGAVRV